MKKIVFYLNLIPEIAVIVVTFLFALDEKYENDNELFLGFASFLSSILFLIYYFYVYYHITKEFVLHQTIVVIVIVIMGVMTLMRVKIVVIVIVVIVIANVKIIIVVKDF